MRSRRWRETLGPPLLATLVAAALVAPTIAGPGPRPLRATVGSTVTAAPTRLAACRGAAIPTIRGGPAARAGDWYRLDPVVDAAGTLTGQRIVFGRVGQRATFNLPLGVESFASGPVDGRVLVGDDDGRASIVRLVDPARRCASVAYEGPTLVRRAVLDPLGGSLVEFRLDRGSRADLGVWRRSPEGSAPVRIVDPLPSIARIGRVFSTELSWSLDGTRLIVASCGEAACVARILDPATGRVTLVDDPGVGEVLGLDGDRLVAYAGCPSLPCDVVVRDVATGRTRTIARAAGLASVGVIGDVAVLAFEESGPGGRLRVVGLDGAGTRTIRTDGERLMPAPGRAGASVALPPGVVALAQTGRPSNGASPATFVRLSDGRRLTAAEVVR